MTTPVWLKEDRFLTNGDKKYQVQEGDATCRVVPPCLQSYIAEAMEHLRLSNTKIILEIPCSNGCNTVMLASSVPFVVVLDTSHQAITQAAKALERKLLPHRQRDNILFQQGDIYHSRFRDASFDGVFCWDLLSYLDHPEDALSEMLRICKPGHRVIGSFFSTADTTRGANRNLLWPDEKCLDPAPFSVRFFAEEEVRQMLDRQPASDLVTLYTIQWSEAEEYECPECAASHEAWIFVLEKKC